MRPRAMARRSRGDAALHQNPRRPGRHPSIRPLKGSGATQGERGNSWCETLDPLVLSSRPQLAAYRRTPVEVPALAALLLAVVLGSGCRSCQRTPGTCTVVGAPSVETGAAPLEVHFAATGRCGDADGSYTWDFGDGSEPVHRRDAVHVYRQPGTFTATVVLADPEHDARDSDQASISVTAP